MSDFQTSTTDTAPGGAPGRLHVAFLLTQSLDSPSGLGRYGPLARSLARRGHRIEVYALHPAYSAEIGQPFNDRGVHVQYVAPMHVRKEGSRKFYYSSSELLKIAMGATQRLTAAALRSHARILHVCKPHPMNAIAGLSGAWLGRKTLFVDCDDYEAGSNLFGAGWQKTIVAGFESRLPRRAVAVTTHSHFMMDKLAAWGVRPEKITYLPNGVEPDRFPIVPVEQVEALRSRLGLNGRQVVAYIGSLSLINHPVGLLLQAFAAVQEQMPESVLLIVGGGEDFELLQDRAIELGLIQKVMFTGRIAPEKVGLYYRLADVSVDPVQDDDAARGRSPLKMFESWLCGTPFITADVGDRRSLMGDPPAGLLVRPGDPVSLAEAILEILQDSAKAKALRERSRRRVQSFVWDTLAGTLEQLYLAHRS